MTIMLTTPDQIAIARLLTIRSGLKMEARGMKMSRGVSCLKLAREAGMTNKRTAAAALVEVNEYIKEHFNL
jgi:hypothetical protein